MSKQKLKIKKRVDKNSNFTTLQQERPFTFNRSDKKYFFGLIKSFLFTSITIVLLFFLNWILTIFPINLEGIYGQIVDNTLKITGILAVGQLFLYVLYLVIIWIYECYKEQKLKWQT